MMSFYLESFFSKSGTDESVLKARIMLQFAEGKLVPQDINQKTFSADVIYGVVCFIGEYKKGKQLFW